ncbi:MAG: PaaI family thioesterase, partial [Vicinamibacteria bacterium]
MVEENAFRLDASPFQRFLGLELLRVEPGLVEIRMPFRTELLREDGSEWLHGGVVSALIDIAGDYAITTSSGGDVPTVDLRIDYLRPARSELVAVGRAVKVGRTVGIADVEVRDREGKVVAVGRGT